MSRSYRDYVASATERHGGRLAVLALCAILVLGLGLRVEFARTHIAHPTPDSLGYGRIAESLYERGQFGQRGDFGGAEVQEPTNYSPGTPLFVAGVYYLTGGVNPLAGRLAIALVSSLAMLFAYLLARRLTRTRWALLAPLAVAVYPPLLEYSGMFMSETLAVTTISGAALAFLWAGERRSLWAWSLPGVLMGVTALIRPEFLPVGAVFAVLALVRLHRDRGWRPGLVGAALLLVAFLIPIIPWTVHNYVTLHRFVPLSTGGGKALFIGTYLPADGMNDSTKTHLLETRVDLRNDILRRFPKRRPGQFEPRLLLSVRRLPPEGVPAQRLLSEQFVKDQYIYLDEILGRMAARRYPGMPTDDALAKMGKSNLVNDVTEHPLSALVMWGYKGWHMWRIGPRKTMLVPTWAAIHAVIVISGLIGLVVLAWRRRWEALVLGSLTVGVTLLGMLLLASERRVLVLLPIVAALGAAGLAWIAEKPTGGYSAPPPLPPASAPTGGTL